MIPFSPAQNLLKIMIIQVSIIKFLEHLLEVLLLDSHVHLLLLPVDFLVLYIIKFSLELLNLLGHCLCPQVVSKGQHRCSFAGLPLNEPQQTGNDAFVLGVR